ncbi:MAG: TRAM domain-containing protein, partial [Acidimicrobiia bacterium]|nr:TRAM domain-containing protein [Acidimicrobiia bacterium]
GRLDGKAVFVPGAVPGDTVDVELVLDKARFARARLRTIIEPSAHRIEMPCPHATECGGCTWQMAPRSLQAEWKEQAVRDALERIGSFESAPVLPITTPGPDFGYRNRIDLHADPAGPGFHRAGSHDVVPIEVCLLAAPPVAALLCEVKGRPADADLTLRAGVKTGEAVIIGGAHARPSEAVITEIVGGERFQISGRAFFQPNTDGAELLVNLVRRAAGNGELLIDAYAGVGLFAGTVGRSFERIVAIEVSRRAVGDLRRNVPSAEVVPRPTVVGLRAMSGPVDTLVVDPPREGLGADTVAEILRIRPRVLVSVSCDAATFARDARQLVDGGYRLESVQPVDQFPQTPHIETVSRFTL